MYRQFIRGSSPRTFLLIAVAEGAFCGISAFLGIHFDHRDLIGPGVGLAVSLHFIPLARIFRMLFRIPLTTLWVSRAFSSR
jgi:hypothetical protein